MFCFFKIRPAFAVLVIVLGASTLSGCNATSLPVDKSFGSGAGTEIEKPLNVAPAKVPPAFEDNISALRHGAVGKNVGHDLNQVELRQALKAEFEALEYSPAGQPVEWKNPVSGNSGVVTASKTYDVGLSNCRQYVHSLIVNGETKTALGTACKEQDGNWVPLEVGNGSMVSSN